MTKRSNDGDDVVVVVVVVMAVLGMVDERNDRLGGIVVVVVVVGVTEVNVLGADTDVSVVPMAGGAGGKVRLLLLLVVAYPRASFALLSLVLEPFFFLVMIWISEMIDTSTWYVPLYIMKVERGKITTSRHWIVF
jgi:hypothetical protein